MNKVTLGLVVGALLLAPVLAFAHGSSDKTPPKILSISIASNNANPTIAKPGDAVTVSFTANEKVTPIVLVESKTLFAKAKNTSGNSWDASYVVHPKDKAGKINYLVTIVDTSKNVYICASVRLPFIGYCPPTNSSSVTIVKDTPPPPPVDVCPNVPGDQTTTPCADQTCAEAGGTWNGTSCDMPPPEPEIFIIAQQNDESNLCTPDWHTCFTDGSSQRIIQLGQGSALGDGSILSVTIAKDETSPFVSNPWIISILCYTDAVRTQTCPDWVTPNSWNGFQTHLITEFATTTTDNKYWTAYFTDPTHETNADGSFPVTFSPAYYYDLAINDNGWNIGAYGSQTEPFWVLHGMTTP